VEAYQDQFLVGQKTLGEEHPETVLTLSKLGEAMTVTSQFYGAEKLLWRALDLAKRLYEREKDDEDVRAYYAICCVNLACFCVEADEPEKAERLYLRACDLLQGPPKGRDDVYSIVLLQLSQARLANGRGDEAVKTASSAVEMIKGHWGAEHRNYGRALAVLADAHLETGHLQEAESLLKQSQEILRRGNDGPDQVTLELGDMTAKLYCKQGKPSEAHELLEKLLAVMEPAWGAEHPMLRSPLRQLAAAKRTLGQETEAQLLERRAQQIEAELSEYKRRRSFNRTWD
jgi:tetratricopeptide (TPR) repeat protein